MFTYEVTLLAMRSGWAFPGPQSQEACVLVDAENDIDAETKARDKVSIHVQSMFTVTQWSIVKLRVIANDGVCYFHSK